MRELLRAVWDGKPIIAMLESDRKKGAMRYEEIVMQLQATPSNMREWGLDKELAAWRDEEKLTSTKPVALLESDKTAEMLLQALFADEPLEWNRTHPVRAIPRTACSSLAGCAYHDSMHGLACACLRTSSHVRDSHRCGGCGRPSPT